MTTLNRAAFCSWHRAIPRLLWALIAGLLLSSGAVHAHGNETGDLRVKHPWTRATPVDIRQAAVFMRIENRGHVSDRLLSAASPVAGRVEVRATPSSIGAIELPARKALELEQRGTYLMLADLQRPLVKGERIPLLLRFERAGELRVELEVQDATSRRSRH